jgi:hypothetical protein
MLAADGAHVGKSRYDCTELGAAMMRPTRLLQDARAGRGSSIRREFGKLTRRAAVDHFAGSSGRERAAAAPRCGLLSRRAVRLVRSTASVSTTWGEVQKLASLGVAPA